MKSITINLRENKIELFVSLLGKEMVKLNDNIVSSKFSFFGTEHVFKIIENEKDVDCKLITGSGIGTLGAYVIDFYENGVPIIESVQQSKCYRILITIMVLLTLILN